MLNPNNVSSSDTFRSGSWIHEIDIPASVAYKTKFQPETPCTVMPTSTQLAAIPA